MASLRDQLAQFAVVPGVRAVVLTGRDGLPMETAGRGDQHIIEALGALGASALSTTEALGQELGSGNTIGAVLEYESGLVTVDPVGEYAALVTLSENAGSLARVRHTLFTTRAELLRTLDGQ